LAENIIFSTFSQPLAHRSSHDLGDAGAFTLGDLGQFLVLIGF
jgi:hypothetical protein